MDVHADTGDTGDTADAADAADAIRPSGPAAPSRPSARRRLAAAAALLALVAAVVAVVWSLLQYPLELPLAVVLLVIAVAAAWTALAHRGVTRVLGVVVAVAALAGTLALPHVHSLLLVIALVVLAVISTATARVAFARDLAPRTDARTVGPAGRGVLLMNPRSGGGKVERFQLEDKAREIGVAPIVLRPGDDLRALAERAVAEGADVIGMAGGDGSQAIVADVARRHDVAFVCVPAGTRNHFALDLGLDRADVAAGLGAYGRAVERRVDLALLGDRVFVNNAALGVYAAVVQSDEYRDAKLATTVKLLPDLVGPDAPRSDLRFPRPDGTTGGAADLVLVSNGAYRLRSLGGFGSRSSVDAGLLGVVTLTVNRSRDLPALAAAEASGRLHGWPGYQEWTTTEFEIASDRPLLDVGVDGEALQLPPPLVFRSLPGALRVRTPVDAPNAAPAALTPAGIGQTIPALLRVLAGRPAR